MMMSMTGYGSSEYLCEQYSLSVEIKSYNNRYLDLQIYSPSYLSVFEQDIKALLKTRIARGHVDVNIRLKQLETDVDIHVDKAAVSKLTDAFRQVSEQAGMEFAPKLEYYLDNDEVLKTIRHMDAERFREAVFKQLELALEPYLESKRAEGDSTRNDIDQQIGTMAEAFAQVENLAGEMEKRLTDNLTEKFRQMVGDGYDEGRILQEVAVMLNRYTVNEEIQRLHSHIAQFRKISSQEGAKGKKLDFLCQEMNREINTIGSKSVIVEVNQAVVVMKDALENIREQLRNIE